MNIANTLKQKNRISGELAKLRQILHTKNRTAVPSTHGYDLNKIKQQMEDYTAELIELKTKIAVASTPISGAMVELTEAKGLIAFYSNLNCSKDPVEVPVGNSYVTKSYEVFLTEDARDKIVSNFQQRINQLQDRIDEFNVSTLI